MHLTRVFDRFSRTLGVFTQPRDDAAFCCGPANACKRRHRPIDAIAYYTVKRWCLRRYIRLRQCHIVRSSNQRVISAFHRYDGGAGQRTFTVWEWRAGVLDADEHRTAVGRPRQARDL